MLSTRKTVAFASALLLALAVAASPAFAAGEADGSVKQEKLTATPYIVGGGNTTASRFPWQVLITANGNQFCGGTLIHPMIVMTAAHCLVDENGEYFEDIPGLEFRAFTGRTKVTEGGEELDWRITRVDPRYNPNSSAYDWGFISLNSPASAPTIQLAGPNERPLWKAGRKAVVTGFGDLADGGDAATVLQQVTVPVLANSGCSRYGSSFHSSTQLCAGYLAGGKDACQGDSGGPLTVTGDNGVRRLIGVVSTGNGCALKGFPGIYSKVADPKLGDEIQQEVEFIEDEDSFPAAYRNIDVVGSGAKPLGCTAKINSRKKAGQRVKSKARSLRAARRTGNRNRIAAAKRSLKIAKHRLKASRTKTRKACF